MVATPKGAGDHSMLEARPEDRETIVAKSRVRAIMCMVKAKLPEL
jgi:hypothetical protein